MNIGGLYCLRISKDIWDNVEMEGFTTGQKVESDESFVVLVAFYFSQIRKRMHLKVLTTSGTVGWIAYVDKDIIMEVTP